MEFSTINPSTEEILKIYTCQPFSEIELMIKASQQAYGSWKKQSIEERAQLVLQFGKCLRNKSVQCAELISREMGKPLSLSMAEIEKCAWLCEYFAEYAKPFLAPEIVQTHFAKSYITYQPLGVILGIMPWNYPFWQVLRSAIPTLLAGNSYLLKHALASTGCGLLIAELFQEAGFPENLFQTIIVDHEIISHIIANPLIKGISLTGSVAAGKAVAIETAKHFKKCILELGGNDPYVILEDADIDEAVDICIKARVSNAGQVCIAAKRIVIVEKIYEIFKENLLKKLRQIKFADPFTPDCQLGPLARKDIRDEVHRQVQVSIEKGAVLLLGGAIPECPGFYYPITVLENIQPGQVAYDEEIFGPVFSLFKARSEEDAIRIANDTCYGLGAAVFTKDIAHGEKIATAQLEAGAVTVNAKVESHPALPFGGIKSSGLGYELGEMGIREFTHAKTVCINS